MKRGNAREKQVREGERGRSADGKYSLRIFRSAIKFILDTFELTARRRCATTCRPPGRVYMNRNVNIEKVDMIICRALVRVVTIDGERFLSGDISEPGIKPLFLLHVTSKPALEMEFLTDGKKLWQVVWYFPVTANAPAVKGLQRRVFGPGDPMTTENMEHIRKAIKRYVEKL